MDNPQDRFATTVIAMVAAQSGLPYSALLDDPFPAITAKHREHVRKTMERYYRERDRLAAIFFIGYDPQRLLEDQRCR